MFQEKRLAIHIAIYRFEDNKSHFFENLKDVVEGKYSRHRAENVFQEGTRLQREGEVEGARRKVPRTAHGVERKEENSGFAGEEHLPQLQISDDLEIEFVIYFMHKVIDGRQCC
jgi:hypothetical protein